MGVLYIMLYVLAGFQLLYNYTSLPDQMATHFDAGGVANGFMPLQKFALFHMGFVMVLSGLFYLTGWMVSKVPPSLVNIPNKKYWLAPERVKTTMQRLRNDVALMGLFAGLFAMAIDNLVMDTNLAGGGHGLDLKGLHNIIVTSAVVAAFYMLFLLTRFRLPAEARNSDVSDVKNSNGDGSEIQPPRE